MFAARFSATLMTLRALIHGRAILAEDVRKVQLEVARQIAGIVAGDEERVHVIVAERRAGALIEAQTLMAIEDTLLAVVNVQIERQR